MDSRKAPEEIRKMSPEELIAEINRVDAQIQQDQQLDAAISGQLMSSWAPHGNGRKVIMFIFLVLGFYNLFNGSWICLLFFFLVAIMSPRIIGECAFAMGRLASFFGGSK